MIGKQSNNLIKSTASCRPATLAMAISTAILAGQAVAEDKATESTSLEKLTIEESVTPETNPYAVPDSPYLAERLSDPRRTRLLAETPQTIQVITSTAIEEYGRYDLREILDAQPGITIGTGENGNAFGDRYIIRGHEARSDIFVDGLRDPGMTIRETFATEQVEISKGPSSTFAGRGTTGGAVNSVSKRASPEFDFGELSAGFGTDNFYRLTADINTVINYDTAVRANLLYATEDVPGREPADRSRNGVAFSVFYQPLDQLEMNVDFYYFNGDDRSDLGTYLEDADGDGKFNDPVDDLPAYAQYEDFLKSTVTTGTLRLGYEFDNGSRLVNLTRYGTTDNGYMLTGAKALTAYRSEFDAITEVNSFDTISMSTHQGWQEVEYFANQLNYIFDLELGYMTHELIISSEYTHSRVLNGIYNWKATGDKNCWLPTTGGNAGLLPVREGYCGLIDGATNNNLLQRDIERGEWDSDWNLDSVSVSLMDTFDIADSWTVFAGVRYDYYDYKLDVQGIINEHYSYTDGDWNGLMGVNYEFIPGAIAYASFSTATNLNGGESDVGISGGYGGFVTDDNAAIEPERTYSYELGIKYRLNDGKLLATAAFFEIFKGNVMEADERGYDALGSANTGKNKVYGVELGLIGNVTDKLSVQIGLAFMNAKVLESAISEDNVGKTLANFADNSASVLLKYQLTPEFAFGGIMTYESERFTGQPDTAANENVSVPEYAVFDLFANYNFNRELSFRLNLTNIANTDYYLTAYRSTAFAYKGDGRRFTITAQYNF